MTRLRAQVLGSRLDPVLTFAAERARVIRPRSDGYCACSLGQQRHLIVELLVVYNLPPRHFGFTDEMLTTHTIICVFFLTFRNTVFIVTVAI